MEQDNDSDSPEDPPAPTTGSGLYYKDGREIPPTHPDHGPMHLIPRQEDGRIAAYYYCSKAELYDAQVPAPPPRRHRRDGFTPERQEQFLEYVRGGASGREAARKVGISPTTAYNLYNSADGAAFRAAWDEAAKVTDIVLEDTAFDRAVNGQEEIVFHKGQRVGTRWKYDNNLLMKLLRARNPLKYAPLSEIEGWLRHRGIAPPANVDGALDRLREAEAEWGRRLPGEEAPALLEDSFRPEPAPPVEPVDGLSMAEERQAREVPPTGSGRAAAERDGPPVQSTSSTSSGTGQAQAVRDPSTSSTSPENGQSEAAAEPSASSASPADGAAGSKARRSSGPRPAPDPAPLGPSLASPATAQARIVAARLRNLS